MKKSDLCLKILEMLFQPGPPLTRPAIVSQTGWRAGSVFAAIDELKAAGLVEEPTRTSARTGRRPPELVLAGDSHWFAGLDFQSHRLLGVIADLSGRIRHSATSEHAVCQTPEACRSAILALLDHLRVEAGDDWGRVCGIGLADPGLVDIARGMSLGAVNIPGWTAGDTGAWLRDAAGLPTGLWPESLVKAYMEYRQRPNCGSLFHIGIDEGVGGGFIKDGRLFAGDTHQAMEIGHIVIAPDGPQCQCGNRGCLEAVVGENGIRRQVRDLVRNGVDTVLTPEAFSLEEFARCVPHDKAARLIAAEVSSSIGRALAIVTALLNPSVIVISGGLTGLGDLLLGNIRQTLELNCFPGAIERLRVEFSSLDRWAAALGAALLLRDRQLLNVFQPTSPMETHPCS